MEPQTPQVNTTGSQDSSQSSLDPQAVNLAKAIRQTESGGNAQSKGKSGEYGAYQWMPSTWTADAESAGVNVPLEKSTLEQQNEVAYKKIENLKSQGYNPAQIASSWNSGDPDAYTGEFSDGTSSIGTNKEGANYNVPEYVNKVTSAYQSLKGKSSTPITIQSSPSANNSNGQSSWISALEGVGAAGLGWLANEAVKPLEGAATGAATGAIAGSILPGEGTLAGGIAGGISGLAEGVIQDIAGNGSSKTSQDKSTSTDSSINGTQTPVDNTSTGLSQSVAASSAIKDAISKTIGSTQSGRAYSNTPAGTDAINTASQFGLIEPNEEGNLTFNSEKLQELESAIENGKDGVIGSQEGVSTNPVSTISAANNAGSFIGNDKINTQADRNKASEIVKSELDADSGGTGQMTLQKMREAQKTHYKAAQVSYANPKPNAEMLAHKALANGYGKSIRDRISDEDKPLYDKLGKMSRDLTNVKSLKKKVEGKKAPKDKGAWETFLKQGARVAEAYIGDKIGGPIGAVIGATAGEFFNRKLDKKFGRNIFETKGMKAAIDILQDTKPKEYKMLIEALKNRGIKFEETDVAPESIEGKGKDVKKDERIMGQKGLVSLKR